MEEDKKKAVLESFEKDYIKDELPDIISGEYNNLSCLSVKDNRKVFLVERIKDGKKMILKSEKDTGRDFLKDEYENLMVLSYGCDEDLKYYEVDGVKLLLRPFYEGTTLDNYISHKCGLTSDESCVLMLTLCNEIRKLHHHKPPLIYRDLKPENILVENDIRLRLIDFDSMRAYEEGKRHDTFYMGSPETAAPEQFGYRQTNERTDIYGLGMIFLYMLTGRLSTDALSEKDIPAGLKKCIERCIAFDPDKRYKRVDDLIKEIRNFQKFGCSGGRLAARIVMTTALIAALFTGAFFAVRGIVSINSVIKFNNPQIESAVRLELKLGDDDRIHKKDLAGVEAIVICGDRVFINEEEHKKFHDSHWEIYESDMSETVADLSDLSLFDNLKELSLCDTGLTKLPDLSALPLETLDVRRNHITSLDGVQNVKTLKKIYAQYTDCTNISAVKGLELEELWLFNSPYVPLDALAGMTTMERLSVMEARAEDIRIINTLDELVELGLYSSEIKSIDEISGLTSLRILNLTYSLKLKSLNGLEAIPGLYYLDVRMSNIRNISALEGQEQLSTLILAHSDDIEDYSVLRELPSLSVLQIDSNQEPAVNALGLENITVQVW